MTLLLTIDTTSKEREKKHREMETQPRARRPISDFVRQLRIDD